MAKDQKASGLHLSVGSLPAVRTDDNLVYLDSEKAVDIDLINDLVNAFLTDEEIKRLLDDREVVSVKNFSDSIRCRVDIFYQKDIVSLSFYFIKQDLPPIEELVIPEALNGFMKQDYGLIVIAGPYACGKSTTIAALLEDVNKNKKKRILSLTTSVEYIFTNKSSIIEQRQVGKDAKNFVDGLFNAMHQDMDIIHISEIKKDFNEAIPLIIDIASGNALVILEMNANSSEAVVEKLLNAAKEVMSEEAAYYAIADVLLGVVIQNLIPKVGGGRIMANEVLVVNPTVKALIREEKIVQIESVIQTSKKEGMVSMEKSIQQYIDEGKVSPDWQAN